MKKAVIYGRVSTQDKQDYSRQINDMDEWAVKNGYEVVGRFAEKVTGASRAYERTEFKNLMKFVEQEKVKMILVSESSRVGRMGIHTRLEIEQLAERGIGMYFYDTGQNTLDKNGKVDGDVMMMIGISLDINKKFLVNLSNGIISGLRNSAKKGKIQGAKFKAYGFTGDKNKNIVPVESEIKIVKEIFKMYDNGLSTRAIANHLNTNKIPTRYNQFEGTLIRGKKAESYSWTNRTIYRVLTNRMLIGERHHKGELVFKFEPVINKEIFEQVQTRLTDKANRPLQMIKNTNYLKGIINCSCGMGMFMSVNEAKRVNSYICLSRAYHKESKCEPCGHPSVNIPKLLNSSYLVIMSKFIASMKGRNSTNFDDKINMKKIEIGNSESALKKVNTKLDNLYDDYNERIITKVQYLKKKEQLEQLSEEEAKRNETQKNDLKQLMVLKNKPLKESYTQEQFLMEVKNILESVTIGAAPASVTKSLKKTETDIAIKVSLKTISGELYTYYLTKYSTQIAGIFGNQEGKYEMQH